MERKLYRIDIGGTMTWVFICCKNGGGFLEGWRIGIGWDDRPFLDYATHREGDSCLRPLTIDNAARIDEANEKLGGNALGEPLALHIGEPGEEVARG